MSVRGAEDGLRGGVVTMTGGIDGEGVSRMDVGIVHIESSTGEFLMSDNRDWTEEVIQK